MRMQIKIFVYDLFALIALVSLATVYLKLPAFSAFIPEFLRVAIQCAWFGALGGVVISLKGIYDHSGAGPHNRWDDSYDLWHIGRPFSAAVAGAITYLLLLAISKNGEVSEPIVYAAAFIMGTQENRFFNFLTEVARLIVQVPSETKAPGFQLTTIKPTHARAGDLVILSGHGFAAQLQATVGGQPLVQAQVSADGTTVAGVLPAHDRGTFDVVITNPDGACATLREAFTFLP